MSNIKKLIPLMLIIATATIAHLAIVYNLNRGTTHFHLELKKKGLSPIRTSVGGCSIGNCIPDNTFKFIATSDSEYKTITGCACGTPYTGYIFVYD